jgi:hypothetical protein
MRSLITGPYRLLIEMIRTGGLLSDRGRGRSVLY